MTSRSRSHLDRMAGVLLVLLALCVAPRASADWVDDWFASSTSGAPGSYQSQQRGYYSAGSFQGRWRMSNDFLVSATPPRLNVGCGGIDLFGGGFSFMDADYLVEKFERIVQAAPAFAFDLAMQEYCKQCLSALEKLTDITDQLNSIQVNDCRMSQRLVSSVANDGNVLRDLWSEAAGEHAVGSSLRKNWQDFQEDTRADHGRPPDDTRALTEQCPDEFKAIFLGGSVLRNVAEELGLDDYADLMRGLVGDVVVSYRDSDRAYTVEVMGACPANDQLSPRDFMSGTVDEKRVDGRCSGAGLTAIADLVEDRLTAIAARIQSGSSAFTDEERGFIDQSPFNLLVLLRDAVQRGTTAETIAAIREPLAMAYAYRVLDDFYQAVQRVQEKAGEVEGNLRAPTSDGGRCDATFLVQATTAVHDMAKRTISFRSLALANYHRAQQELATNMAVAAQQLADRRRSLNTLGAQGER